MKFTFANTSSARLVWVIVAMVVLGAVSITTSVHTGLNVLGVICPAAALASIGCCGTILYRRWRRTR